MSVLFACCALVGITFPVAEKALRNSKSSCFGFFLQFDIKLCRVRQLFVEDFSVLNGEESASVSQTGQSWVFMNLRKLGLESHLI